MNNKYYAIKFSDELYHHGILGQKWGVRRYQDKNGRLTAAGKKHVEDSKKKPEWDHDRGDDRIRQYVLVGSTIAASVLGSIGLLSVGLISPHLIAAGALATVSLGAMAVKDLVSEVKKKNIENETKDNEIDKKTGLKLKNKDFSTKQDLKRVNPEFINSASNTKSNCMLCTTAYDMRKRGYEVQANKASYGYDYEDVKNWYPKAELKEVSDKNIKNAARQLAKELSSQGEGARGNLMVQWDYYKTRSFGGHSMIYEVENGKVMLRDAQNGKTYGEIKPEGNLITLYPLRNASPTLTYARLDNVKPDPKRIKEAVH